MHVDAHINAWLVVGFGLGLVLFFRGLGLFRRGLMVADTPLIPIRSVAMGIAQVHGQAGGDEPFPSPVSGTPCYAFKVVIDRYGQRNGWRHHRTDQNGKSFYLSDDSGKVLVQPREAELDVPRNCIRQVGGPTMSFSLTSLIHPLPADASDGSDLSVNAKTDDQLLEYAGVGYECMDGFRFTEFCLKPGEEYDVLGTCVENPKPLDENDRNLITKGKNNHNFLISSKSVEQLEQGMSWRSAMMIWGGAALTVACAGLFMAIHDLL